MNCFSFQSVCTCSSSQTFLKRMWSSIFAVIRMSDFGSSACTLSGLAAFSLLILLMIMLITLTVGAVTSICVSCFLLFQPFLPSLLGLPHFWN